MLLIHSVAPARLHRLSGHEVTKTGAGCSCRRGVGGCWSPVVLGAWGPRAGLAGVHGAVARPASGLVRAVQCRTASHGGRTASHGGPAGGRGGEICGLWAEGRFIVGYCNGRWGRLQV